MDVFVFLANHANELVSRDQLLESIWSEHVAADELLTGAVSHLRRALQVDQVDLTFIETIPKRGYRLTGEVRLLDGVGSEKAVTRGAAAADVSAPALTILRTTAWTLGVAIIAATILVTLNIGGLRERLLGEATPQPITSIAVLPFVNMSDNPQQEYFSDGLSEEILNLLAQIPDLHVTSRSSAFSFRGQDVDIPTIAGKLGVAYVLEGSVRRAGNQLRIAAQLIEADSDTHLWSRIYDRELSDVFAVQEEIAQAVAVALQDVLGVRTVEVDILTNDLEAYQLFLKGRQMFYQRGEALNGAIAVLRMAVDRDPSFAVAWAFLAAAAEIAPDWITSISEEDADALADEASRIALDLNPNLGLALAARARLTEGRGDLVAALNLYNHAVIANPGDSTIQLWFGLFNFHYGYLGEALLHLERSYELDPLVGNTSKHLAAGYLISGQEERAQPHLAKARDFGAGMPRSFLSHHVLTGNMDAAWQHIEAAISSQSPHAVRLKQRIYVALKDTDSTSIGALIAEEDEFHGAGNWYRPEYFMWLNLKDEFFDHYSPQTSTTPLYDLRPAWLPGNRAFVEDLRFFEIMRGFGADVLWEQRGYPDGCVRAYNPLGDHLDCTERYR
jgi:TolB-like protein/Tfp pilus assembly protein PilF